MAYRSKKWDLIILIVAGILFGLGYLYYSQVETRQIKNDYSLTKGKIYELAGEPDEFDDVFLDTRYKYKVDGKEYERGNFHMDPCDGFEDHISEIKQFEYPIIYNNKDPEKSRILISPKHFEQFDVAYLENLRNFYETYWSCK